MSVSNEKRKLYKSFHCQIRNHPSIRPFISDVPTVCAWHFCGCCLLNDLTHFIIPSSLPSPHHIKLFQHQFYVSVTRTRTINHLRENSIKTSFAQTTKFDGFPEKKNQIQQPPRGSYAPPPYLHWRQTGRLYEKERFTEPNRTVNHFQCTLDIITMVVPLQRMETH